MDAEHATADLLTLARELIFSLDALSLAPFHPLWPPRDSALPATVSAASAAGVPVLRWLPGMAAATHEFAGPLVAALGRAAPTLDWRQTYTAAELGAAFMNNYGHAAIVGPGAPQASERIACGFLMLGPHTLYPRHRHEADEVYIPLRGVAQWLQGDAVWREHAPGTVIHHASEEPHALRSGGQPLLALYLWRSSDLNQRARLDIPHTAAAGEHA